MRVELVFDLLCFWHAGTGRGDGPVADAVLARTAEGLPYLPGRTVKGLARDAVQLAAAAGFASREQVEAWFGTGLVQGTSDNRVGRLEEARFQTHEGALRFGSATLGTDWARWARAKPTQRERLVTTFASTKIEAGGVALDRSLRVIEMAVPMLLRAPVEERQGASSGALAEAAGILREALPLFVRGVGSHRNRGLGRVRCRLEEVA